MKTVMIDFLALSLLIKPNYSCRTAAELLIRLVFFFIKSELWRLKWPKKQLINWLTFLREEKMAIIF